MLTASERGRPVASRIKGKWAIVRSLSLLVIRVNRFSEYRAQTQQDHRWAARLFDDLDVALRHARQETE